jgi:hypothetical protein
MLVSVIEARQLADRHHHCDRDQRSDSERVVAEDRHRKHKGGRRRDQVGDDEQAASQGIA